MKKKPNKHQSQRPALSRLLQSQGVAPIPPVAHLERLGKEMNALRPVGYWRGLFGHDDGLPDPRQLVRPRWLPAHDKKSLLDYLRAGAVHRTCRGFSYCRFECGIAVQEMGSRDLTDGTWMWPEGLAHYVEAHDVALPDDFVQHARKQGWKISASRETPEGS